MKALRPLLTLVCLLLMLSPVRSQVSVEQRLDSMEMLIGEHVHLTLTAHAAKNQRVQFPTLKEGSELIPGIEVLGVAPVDTQQMDNGQMQLSQALTLTSFDDTLYLLPALKVSIDGKSYSGKEIPLKVSTVEVDTANKDSMLIPFGVQTEPTSLSEWLPVVFAALIILLLLGAVAYLFRRLKDNRPVLRQFSLLRQLPPHQKALKALRKLQQRQHSHPDDSKVFYTRITEIIRKYLGDQQHFDAMEMTTGDILHHLQSTPLADHNAQLEQLLNVADLVKFAKYTAAEDERTRHINEAIGYIDLTKDQAAPAEVEQKPQPTVAEQRSVRARRAIKAGIVLCIIAAVAVAVYIVWKVSWLL